MPRPLLDRLLLHNRNALRLRSLGVTTWFLVTRDLRV
jgi:hypothetical protein